jgi:hypothetical protein
VTKFKSTAYIYYPDGNPYNTLFFQYDTANGLPVLKRGDIIPITIGSVSSDQVGMWKVIVKVQLLNETDMDAYNDTYRRSDQETY